MDILSSLRELLEIARDVLLTDDDFDPLYIIFDADTEPRFITRNIRKDSDRIALAVQVRRILQNSRPIALFGIMLAWAVRDDEIQNYEGYLRNHPKRQEMIVGYAKNAQQQLMIFQKVYRSGSDLELGEEEICDDAVSRFSDCHFYAD